MCGAEAGAQLVHVLAWPHAPCTSLHPTLTPSQSHTHTPPHSPHHNIPRTTRLAPPAHPSLTPPSPLPHPSPTLLQLTCGSACSTRRRTSGTWPTCPAACPRPPQTAATATATVTASCEQLGWGRKVVAAAGHRTTAATAAAAATELFAWQGGGTGEGVRGWDRADCGLGLKRDEKEQCPTHNSDAL